MQALYLDWGAGGPQLKRNPLGSANHNMIIAITPGTAPSLALEIAGVSLVAIAINAIVPAWRSKRWLPTRGKIMTSRAVASAGPVQWGRGTTLLWDPGIVYQYTVEGTTYRGTRLNFNGHVPTVIRVQRIVDRYPIGQPVTVWYNPVDPSSAVLEPGPANPLALELCLGLVFIAIGILLNPPHVGAA